MQPAADEVTIAHRPGGWPVLAVVAVGGALGALARHAVDLALPPAAAGFPTGTLLVNLTGCLLIGLVAGSVHRTQAHPLLLPFVVTGLLGGFTTFSTYAVQTVDVALRGQVGIAAGYLFGTLVLALVAVEAGLLVNRWLIHLARRRRPLPAGQR